MNKMIDYFYTHSSPWTYLGSVRFHEIAKAAGASINYRPCNLGRIFPQSGGLPLPKRAPQRQRYRMFELKRWRDHLGVEITLEPAAVPRGRRLWPRSFVWRRRRGWHISNPLKHLARRQHDREQFGGTPASADL